MYSFLIDISYIAAATRSNELTNVIQILSNKYLYLSKPILSIFQVFKITLVSSASFITKEKWIEFIGDYFTRFCYKEMSVEDAKRLLEHISFLCIIEPKLCEVLGKPRVLLNVYIDSAS